MRVFVSFVALVALALPTFAQQQPFEEQIEVNAVLLDVIVTDPQGNQILGLTKDDFVVKENGVEQPVETVDYFTNRQLLDSREANAPFKVEQVREDRYFIFFFDKPDNPTVLFDQLNNARTAIVDFLDNKMKETDLVAIVGHDVRLKVYSDFTNDKAALRKALDESTRFGRGITTAPAGDGPSILRNVDKNQMNKHTGTVYQALDLLADSVRNIRARKNLVLFSPGIADMNEDMRDGMLTSRSRYVDPAIQSLNAANVTVYAAQLQRQIDPSVNNTMANHQRLNEFADATGGKYYQFSTSFKPVVEQIEEKNSGYYLLTYRSRKPRGDKGFQKVNVSVKSPELRVTARAGYEFGS
jgi:VWFA-related protein